MSSTEFNIGLGDARSSSRVMKPPVSLLICKIKSKKRHSQKIDIRKKEKSQQEKKENLCEWWSNFTRFACLQHFYLMFPLCPFRAVLHPTFSLQPTRFALMFVQSTTSKTAQISTFAWTLLIRMWKFSNSFRHHRSVMDHLLPNSKFTISQTPMRTRWMAMFRLSQHNHLPTCRSIIIIVQPLSGKFAS